MTISTNFPGGNAIIKTLDENHYFIEPDLRDTTTDWFYWCFQLTAKPDQVYTLDIRNKCTTNKFYALSYDQGFTWQWGDPNTISGNTITYRGTLNANEILFCVGMSYTTKNWLKFISNLADKNSYSLEVIGHTQQNRPLPLMRIKSPEEPKYKIVFTARHHACEMMANYLIEGVIEEFLYRTNPVEIQDFEFAFIPFVDLDGVENGDQGKNRSPHDHNRDYIDLIYPETKCVINEILKNPDCQTILLDVHCPHLKGPYNEEIYLVGTPSDENTLEQRRFLKFLEKSNDSTLPITSESILPHGQSWNTLTDDRSTSRWSVKQSHVKLATSIELPYAIANGQEVNQESSRHLGNVFAKAVIQYCKQL